MLIIARHLSRCIHPPPAAAGALAKAYAASSAAHYHHYFTTASTASSSPFSIGPSSLTSATHTARPSLFAVTKPSLPIHRTLSTSSASPLKESYDHILAERRFPENNDDVVGGGVGIVTLHRPKALNALCDALFEDLMHAVTAFEEDDDIGCIVITGSGKAFAAGADISEMSTREFATVYKKNMFSQWAEITKTSKPIIAAINGFALGGGCELAMMCDILLAGSKAKFGQPEINLGVIPGAGGTQRLIRAVGKSKAMEMCLTGNMINAQEAMDAGLVSKVIDSEILLEEAVKMGFGIAEKGGVAVRMCKEAVNVAEETTLSEGLRFERRMFHALFATKDQKEGMSAFLEKRKPNFTNE